MTPPVLSVLILLDNRVIGVTHSRLESDFFSKERHGSDVHQLLKSNGRHFHREQSGPDVNFITELYLLVLYHTTAYRNAVVLMYFNRRKT